MVLSSACRTLIKNVSREIIDMFHVKHIIKVVYFMTNTEIKKVNSRMSTSQKRRKQGYAVTQDFLYVQSELRKHAKTWGRYNKKTKTWEFKSGKLKSAVAEKQRESFYKRASKMPKQYEYERVLEEQLGIGRKNYKTYGYAMHELKTTMENLGFDSGQVQQMVIDEIQSGDERTYKQIFNNVYRKAEKKQIDVGKIDTERTKRLLKNDKTDWNRY